MARLLQVGRHPGTHHAQADKADLHLALPLALLPIQTLLHEDVLGDLRRGHRRRPAGIKREMGDDLADLVLGDAVVERPLQVADELLLAAQGDQGRTMIRLRSRLDRPGRSQTSPNSTRSL